MSKHQFNRNFAIVIGINDYTNGIKELETAAPDALKLAQILQKQHQALKPQYQAQNRYEVQLILNKRATLHQLNQLISGFKKGQIPLDNEKVVVTKDDRVLFYFAGHGIALEALENQEGPVGYLIPQDATKDVSSTYLPMQELHDALNALPCRHMLAILDCCFAGAFRWASLKREIVPKVTVYKERYDRFISDHAWQVITSAADDQKALDSLGGRGKIQDGNEIHSPFAKALFDALRGEANESADLNKDGIITATELYSYLRDKVEILTQKHYKRQTPGLCPLRKHDKGEFIFLLPDFERDALENAPPLNPENNPYRGLESYEEEHCDLFFGREKLIEELYQKVVKQTLTVVLGASGTGKSSLVKAGLIPFLREQLKANTSQQYWYILAPLRLGESPFKALNNTLVQVLGLATASEASEQPRGDKPNWLDKILNWFRGQPVTPNQSHRLLQQKNDTLSRNLQIWSQKNPTSKLLLVIDQSEELITLCQDEKEREEFFSWLAYTLDKYSKQLRIVLTLRNDFEPQFQDTALKEYWKEARFFVPAMTRASLLQAIEKPAEKKVIYFESRDQSYSLVDRLLDEVAQTQGALPLLSFTLSELYLKYLESVREEKRNNRALTQDDYEELGGVARSLTQRADQEYEKLVYEDKAYDQTFRHVMLRMVAVDGGELARRRVLLSELEYPEQENARVKKVIGHLSSARLLTSGTNAEDQPYVEPVHDALVSGWQRLGTWKDQELTNLALQRELTPTAEKWVRDGKNKQVLGLLWDDDPRLPLLKQTLTSDRNWLNCLEIEFVQKSLELKRQKLRRLIGSLVFVFASLTGLTVFALIQLQYSLLREKAATVRNQLASEPVNSLVRAIQATGESNSHLRQVLSQVEYSLSEAVAESREQVVIHTAQGAVSSVAFSPDGQTIASGGEDGTIRLWDLTGKPLPVEFSGHQEGFRAERSMGKGVNAVAFSPDGQTIVSGGSDGTVRLWDLKGNQIDMLTYREPVSVTSVALNSTDEQIVISTDNGAISLWNPQNRAVKLLATNNTEIGVIYPAFVTFSPDGQRIAATTNGELILWDNNGNQLSRTDGNGEHSICSLAFSSNSKSVIIGRGICSDSEGTISKVDFDVEQWELNEDDNTLYKNQSFSGHTTHISSVASGWDGMIASGSTDNTIRLWQTSDNPPILRGHTGAVKAVAFNPKQQQLASASSDGTIRLWDSSYTFNILNIKYQGLEYRGEPIDAPSGYIYDYVNSTAFSPDGNIFAVARQNMVMLFSSQGELIGLPFREDEGKEVTAVAFSPDGKTILSGISQYDDTIQDTTTYLRLSDLNGNTLQLFQAREGKVNSVAFSSDGKTIVSGSNDKTLRLWDLNGNTLQVFSGHEGEVNSVAFSPDGKTILSGSNDKTLRLWDLNGNTLQVFSGHEGEVNSVAFSADGKTILSGSDDKTLRFWDLQGRPTSIQVLTAHSGAVKAVAYSPDGKTIISASTDQTIKFWNLDGSLKILPFQNLTEAPFLQIVTAVFSSDGKTVLTSIQTLKETGGHLRLIRERRDWKDWLTVACNRLLYHEVLVNPQTDIEKGARATCEANVWNHKSDSNSSSRAGYDFEVAQQLPLTGVEQSKVQPRPQNTPSPTPPSNNGQNNYRQAPRDRNQASKLNSTSVDAYINQGLTYHRQRNYQQAISSYSKAIALNPNSDKAYSNRAAAYNEQKDYPKAIADSSQAISLNPTYANAYINRAIAYYHQGNFQQAIADYNKAIKLAPGSAIAYHNRAQAYTRLGNKQSAQADRKKAAELSRPLSKNRREI